MERLYQYKIDRGASAFLKILLMTNMTMTTKEKIIKSENFAKKTVENQAFHSCTFISCDFTESILRNADFSACTFKNCNLSLPKLDGCRFHDVQFVDCKITGAEFYKCQKAFFSPSFTQCLLQFCNFSEMNMKNVSFKQCKIQESYFTSTVLKGANFADTDLSGTVFHNCDLSKADFSTATRYNIAPQTNKIKKAKFSMPEAIGLLHGFDIVLV